MIKRLGLILCLLLALGIGPRQRQAVLSSAWSEARCDAFVRARTPTAWWRADTVTASAAGLVSQINDISGNSRHLTQADDAKKPTLVGGASGLGGRQALSIDGTNDFMSAGAVTLGDIIDADKAHFFVAWQAANFAASRWFFTDVNYKTILLSVNTGVYRFYNNDGTEDTIDLSATADRPAIMEAKHEGGSIYARLNAGKYSSTASGNTADVTGALRVLSDNSSNTFLGLFAEMIVFDKALSSYESDVISRCLVKKYGADLQ